MDIGSLTGSIELEDQLSGSLTTITSRVKQFANSFSGALAASATGAGAVSAAVVGIAASITGLGEKGSVILGVEEAFDRLARQAGSTGDAFIRGLSTGVRDTIDSMELMQATTRLLSSGIKLSEADMRMMGATAREMGKATGTSAASGLNVLSQALLTGNTRSLKRYSINVDLVKAEKDFAASIGTVREELSEAGRLEARRIAMLEGMRQKLSVLGESELTFKERVQQSRVAVGNWFDSLAKGIASSPAVNKAFDSIRNAIVETFGGTSQTLLQTIIGWVDKFAEAAGRIGPAVIEAIGTVKDRIASIWNEIVAFNERWQITNNLMAGAKFAWGLLEKAFYLVKSAVIAVKDAWASMPEWLQKITRTALEGSVALAVYSVAIRGAAVPFRAFVETVDLGINLIGNATSAIYNLIFFQKTLGITTDALSAAYVRHTATLRASIIVTKASEIATRATAAAQAFWGGVLTTIGNTVPVLTARIWLMEASLRASEIVANVATAAKIAYHKIIFTLGNSVPVLTARIWLLNAGVTASGIAARAGTAGMVALGTALKAVQYVVLPLITAWAAFTAALAVFDWTGLSERIEYLSLKLQRFLGLISESATDADLWNSVQENMRRRTGETVQGIDAETDALNRLKDEISGATIANEVEKLRLAFANLTPTQQQSADVMKRVGEQAYLLRERGGRLHPELAALADAYSKLMEAPKPTFIRESTEAEELAKKIRDLGKSYSEVASGQSVFAAAFEKLTKEQRDNYDLQQVLAPEIDKLAAAYKPLTDEMVRVRYAATEKRLELIAGDVATLKSLEVTSGQIEVLKKLGMTEAEIAFQYGVTVEALQKHNAEMQKAVQIEQNLASFQFALVEQERREAERREALFKGVNEGIADAERDLNDFIKEQSLSTAEFQSELIDREAASRIASFTLQYGASQRFNDFVLALAKRRKDALVTDNEALKSNSIKTLQEQAARAKETYQYMAAHPEQYSKHTIERFRRIAEAAKNQAEGTKSAWQTTYEALGDVATILDAIPGRFTEIAAMAARAGQAIMNNLAEGDWVGAIVAGATAAISIFGKLFGILREGRNAVKEFAASFDTIAEGTGFDELHRELLALGKPGEQLWIKLTQGTPAGNKEIAKRNIAEVQAALDALEKDMQRYELTWKDLVDRRGAARQAGQALVDTYQRLTDAGYSADTVLKRMSGDLNQYIIDSVRAGTKIPQSMQVIIAKMIETKQITQEAAAAMLGLHDSAMPSLADITAAAERYGLTLDDLGPKVRQLKITEVAGQIVKDFEVLMNAGVPFETLMTRIPDSAIKAQKELEALKAKGYDAAVEGSSNWKEYQDALAAVENSTKSMGQQIQSLVTDALRYGMELPAGMQPIIEQMIEQGQLTDEAGEKLTDLSKLTFAADLTEMFESLMTKLDELIEKISSGVGGALEDVGRRVVYPRVVPVYEDSGPSLAPPQYHARGGRVIPFAPRGMDRVPAMLTPGERVLTVSETRAYESRSNIKSQTIVVELNRQVLAKETAEGTPEYLRIRTGR